MHVESTERYGGGTQDEQLDREEEQRVEGVVAVQAALLEANEAEVDHVEDERRNGRVHVQNELFEVLLLERRLYAAFGDQDGQSEHALGARVEHDVHDRQVQVETEGVGDWR